MQKLKYQYDNRATYEASISVESVAESVMSVWNHTHLYKRPFLGGIFYSAAKYCMEQIKKLEKRMIAYYKSMENSASNTDFQLRQSLFNG